MKSRGCAIGLISLALATAVSPAALAAAGELDLSVSGNGKQNRHFKGGDNYAGDVAIQADGLPWPATRPTERSISTDLIRPFLASPIPAS